MSIDDCNGNWNHMYEFKLCGNWYPCHVIEKNDTVRRNNNRVWIFTRNGTITTERNENVRKMSEKRYLEKRLEDIEYLGKSVSDRGYHENIEEDLALFFKTLEVKDIG